jgi:putative transposase
MAKYDPQKHHRWTIRLKGYDYSSPGAYFVTICTRERECVLDDPVVTGIITDVWHALPGWFPTIGLDEFVVMPNHVHFILWIHQPDDVGATLAVAQNAADTEPGDDGVGATLAVAQDGAGASPAPTEGETRDVGVGATLAVAQNAVAQDVVAAQRAGANRAGASPAPTEGETGDGVGATLAVAQNAVAENTVAQHAPWTIPEPEKVNPNPTLGDVVGAFQSLVFTVYLDWIEANDPTRRAKFWQRNYYEHVIRNERELQAIRLYIRLNPDNWALDRDNPDNIRRFPPPETVEDYVREALAGGENGMG